MKAPVYRWTELDMDNPVPLLTRKRIMGEKVMLARVLLAKGCHVPVHAHENEQIAWVVSGRAHFHIGEPGSPEAYDVVVSGGEVLHLPSNLPHGVDALEDTEILDVLSPPGPMGVDRPDIAAQARA